MAKVHKRHMVNKVVRLKIDNKTRRTYSEKENVDMCYRWTSRPYTTANTIM